MENTNETKRLAGKKIDNKEVSNRPGQQLPDKMEIEATNKRVDESKERHSESSMPNGQNETLGTP